MELAQPKEKRKRGSNFSSEDKQKLINLLIKCKETILNKKTDGTTNHAKVLAWTNIVVQFNCSSNTYRSKDSLMKLWEKMKTEAKLYAATNRKSVTGTGGGPSTSQSNPILDQVCDILGRGCTGILAVNDSDAIIEDNNEPIIIDDAPMVDLYNECIIDDAPTLDNECEIERNNFSTGTGMEKGRPASETPAQTPAQSRPLWTSRRRPQHTSSTKNERSAVIETYKDVNKKKMDIEELRHEMLQEEAAFKRQLYKSQLEMLKRQLKAAAYDIKLKKQKLCKIKGGDLSLRGTSEQSSSSE